MKRETRLRKEFLYRKSLEAKERQIFEHKQKIKKAVQDGKAIPTELRKQEEQLRNEIQLDDEKTEIPWNPQDDEYQRAGEEDPKIIITTSRDPSTRLTQFLKEMKLIIPNSQRINRGTYSSSEILEAAKKNNVTDVIILHEHRGEPDGMIVSHLPFGPTAFFGLVNVVMRHEIQVKDKISEAFPHLIFDNFNTRLGERVATILKHIFPVPKPDSLRVMTFANRDDFISFRHHTYESKGHKEVELTEVGPRFEMRLFQIKLGTYEQAAADTEWAYRPYMNTSKRRRFL